MSGEVSGPLPQDSESAVDSLRILRRGILRSEGFALFVAVCNQPPLRDSLIRALRASLPQQELRRIDLSGDSQDVLAAVSASIADTGAASCALMICGLENAVPGDGANLAPLHGLNLRRQSWREGVPRAVVFWVPEYLVRLLAQEAPDFFAWRRDVVAFPAEATGESLRTFEPSRLAAGLRTYMTSDFRRARLAELMSRIRTATPDDRAAVSASYAEWKEEAAEHLCFLGQTADAARLFAEAWLYWTRSNKPRQAAWAAVEFADVQLTIGNSRAAETHLKQARDLFKDLADSDPANADWQHDLSISFNKLGDLATDQGKLPAAERHFAAALAIRKRLADSEPANAAWQRGLSISFERLGDLSKTQGKLPDAERHFSAALAIRKRLADSDPANAEWQRDLSISFNKLGDLATAQGTLPDAERHFSAALAIAQRLADSDPANAAWQRDLSVSFNKLGDLATAQGTLPDAERHFSAALAIRKRLADSDPANAEWQRDLSVSLDRLGDLATDQGKLSDAERHFSAALAIRKRLADSDPANTDWQRGWFISLIRLADLARRSGDTPRALTLAEQGHAISERLALLDPTNATWQNDAAYSRQLLAEVRGPADTPDTPSSSA